MAGAFRTKDGTRVGYSCGRTSATTSKVKTELKATTTFDTGALGCPQGAKLWKLRGTITASATFVPGTDRVFVFLANDSAGDIPITLGQWYDTTAGATDAAKGSVVIGLDGIPEGFTGDRDDDGSIWVVTQLLAGTATIDWRLTWEDAYGSPT